MHVVDTTLCLCVVERHVATCTTTVLFLLSDLLESFYNFLKFPELGTLLHCKISDPTSMLQLYLLISRVVFTYFMFSSSHPTAPGLSQVLPVELWAVPADTSIFQSVQRIPDHAPPGSCYDPLSCLPPRRLSPFLHQLLPIFCGANCA